MKILAYFISCFLAISFMLTQEITQIEQTPMQEASCFLQRPKRKPPYYHTSPTLEMAAIHLIRESQSPLAN